MENIVLASALRTLISNMSKRLRKQMQATDNLSISAVTTLSHLYTESLTPSQLAELVKVKTQSMSEVLSHLDHLGIIIKTPSQQDKRKMLISLTYKGRQIVEQTRYERDEWLTSAIEANLTGKEKKVVSDAIKLIEKLVDHQ